MSGTRTGGKQALETIISKHGRTGDGKSAFHHTIGSQGGKIGRTGGFYKNRELAIIAGAIGGSVSRRGPVKLTEEERLEKKLQAIKREYDRTREIKQKAERQRRREMLEQAKERSEMQVSKLSAKYGKAKSW